MCFTISVANSLHLTEGGAFHLAGEVVGDGLAADGAVEALDDEVGGLDPAHVAEHHLAAEDRRSRG
jgi:hypothetical protein